VEEETGAAVSNERIVRWPNGGLSQPQITSEINGNGKR